MGFMKRLSILVVISFGVSVLVEPTVAAAGARVFQTAKTSKKSKTKKAQDAGLGAVGQPLGGVSKGIGNVAKPTGGVSKGIGDVGKPRGGVSPKAGGSVSTVVSGRKAPVVRTPPQLPAGLSQTHGKSAGRTPPSLPASLGQVHKKTSRKKASGDR